MPAVAAPDRKQIREAGLVRDVRIPVEHDVHAPAARVLDATEDVVELAPVARPLRLEVRDLQRAPRLPRDVDRLVDRVEQAIVLVAHVRRVRKPSPRPAARITRPARPATRTRPACTRAPTTRRTPRSAIASLTIVVMRRSSSGVAGRSSSPTTIPRMVPSPIIDATFTELGSVIDGRSRARRTRRSRLRRRPMRRDGKARAAVLPDDDRGDALTDHRLRSRVGEQRSVAVRVDVDESRRDGDATRVDLDRALVGDSSRDSRDAARLDGDVHLDRGRARAIDHGAAADHEVVCAASRQDDRRARPPLLRRRRRSRSGNHDEKSEGTLRG